MTTNRLHANRTNRHDDHGGTMRWFRRRRSAGNAGPAAGTGGALRPVAARVAAAPGGELYGDK